MIDFHEASANLVLQGEDSERRLPQPSLLLISNEPKQVLPTQSEREIAVSEFGHFYTSRDGFLIDTCGAGPFVITVGARKFRFEDSDRFGPAMLNKRGDPTGRFFPERSPFWRAWGAWKRQGRRVADDGVTCVYDTEENLR